LTRPRLIAGSVRREPGAVASRRRPRWSVRLSSKRRRASDDLPLAGRMSGSISRPQQPIPPRRGDYSRGLWLVGILPRDGGDGSTEPYLRRRLGTKSARCAVLRDEGCQRRRGIVGRSGGSDTVRQRQDDLASLASGSRVATPRVFSSSSCTCEKQPYAATKATHRRFIVLLRMPWHARPRADRGGEFGWGATRERSRRALGGGWSGLARAERRLPGNHAA